MSARRMKAARAAARRLERQVDREAHLFCWVPWYIRPFRRWRTRWLDRWEREHRAALAEALRTDQVVQSTSLADQLKARRDARRGA